MEQISKLLFRHLEGNLNPQEQVVLDEWLGSNPANRRLIEKIQNGEILKTDIREWYAIPSKGLDDDKRLQAVIEAHHAPDSTRRFFSWLPYAAIVLCTLTFGLWFGLQNGPNSQVEDQVSDLADILPGGNRATLTLPDGKVLDLSTEKDAIVVGENIQYQDGSVVLDLRIVDPLGTDVPANSDEYVANRARLLTLSTPKGGMYKVILADGTQVWLNAQSSLRYPNRFASDERVVYLDGEAYFEVQTSKSHPFKVITKKQTVQVTGTKFNIQAYSSEAVTKTTLLTGSVNILSDQRTVVLLPGQQALSDGTKIGVQDVDSKQAIAWTDGRFSFTGKPFGQIMNEVERWYSIQVDYEGQVPAIRFYGGAKRTDNLSTVMRLLESGEVEYKLEGRRLVIINKK